MYKINAKIVFSNGRYQTLQPTRKSKIVRNVVLDKMKSGYLKVTYLNNKNLINEGTYNNKKDFIKALNAFTEKPLLDYIKGGTW